jgi:hypothetical protein
VKSLPLATIYEVKIPLRKWKKSLLQRNPAQMTSANDGVQDARQSVKLMIRVSWVRFSAREFHFFLTQRKSLWTGGALYVSKLTTNNNKLAWIAIWL